MIEINEAEDALKYVYLDCVAAQLDVPKKPTESKVVRYEKVKHQGAFDQATSSGTLYIGRTVVKIPKTGRNELCPCGSGIKFKKCCLNKEK